MRKLPSKNLTTELKVLQTITRADHVTMPMENEKCTNTTSTANAGFCSRSASNRAMNIEIVVIKRNTVQHKSTEADHAPPRLALATLLSALRDTGKERIPSQSIAPTSPLGLLQREQICRS